jgi:hypothetical protein
MAPQPPHALSPGSLLQFTASLLPAVHAQVPQLPHALPGWPCRALHPPHALAPGSTQETVFPGWVVHW